MKKLAILFCFFLFNSSLVHAQDESLPYVKNYGAPNLLLLGENKIFSLSELMGNISVMVFLSPDCPLSQKYTLTLKKIMDDFKSSGINFYTVFPGERYTQAELLRFKEKYELDFIFLHDTKLEFARKLNAGITPEVFVLDKNMNTIYSGAIDNWYISLGKNRSVITENYLRDALSALLQKKEIAIKKTTAIGCIIETGK